MDPRHQGNGKRPLVSRHGCRARSSCGNSPLPVRRGSDGGGGPRSRLAGPCAKLARKLFRGLGALRDAQVMDRVGNKKARPPKTDPVRAHLQTAFESNEPSLRRRTLSAWRTNSTKSPGGAWSALCATLPPCAGWESRRRMPRARTIRKPPGELHAKALRTEKSKPWHALRIGLKRFPPYHGRRPAPRALRTLERQSQAPPGHAWRSSRSRRPRRGR